MKEKNWEVLVLNEQVGQIGETGVAPMVTVSLVNVQQDSLMNKSETVNEVQLWLNMIKYENKMQWYKIDYNQVVVHITNWNQEN